MTICKTERGLSPEPDHMGSLIFTLQPPDLREIFLCCLSHPVHVGLLGQPELRHISNIILSLPHCYHLGVSPHHFFFTWITMTNIVVFLFQYCMTLPPPDLDSQQRSQSDSIKHKMCHILSTTPFHLFNNPEFRSKLSQHDPSDSGKSKILSMVNKTGHDISASILLCSLSTLFFLHTLLPTHLFLCCSLHALTVRPLHFVLFAWNSCGTVTWMVYSFFCFGFLLKFVFFNQATLDQSVLLNSLSLLLLTALFFL